MAWRRNRGPVDKTGHRQRLRCSTSVGDLVRRRGIDLRSRTGVGFPYGPGITAGTDLFPPIRAGGDPGGDAASLFPEHPRVILLCDTVSLSLQTARDSLVPMPELPWEFGRLS